MYLLVSARGETTEVPPREVETSQNGPILPGSPPSREGTTTNPPPPPPGEVIFEDDFSDSGGWSVGTTGNGDSTYTKGGYELSAFVSYGAAHAQADEAGNLKDVIVEVYARRTGDVSDVGISYFGIACRVKDELDKGMIEDGYVMGIWDSGLIQIQMRKEDSEDDYDLLGETDKFLETIPKGEKNHIRADCVGNKLTLYVNNVEVYEKVIEGEDAAEFESGRVGLFMYNESENGSGTEVLFVDFKVSEVE